MTEKKKAHYPVDEWIRELTPEQIGMVLTAFRGQVVDIIKESDASLRTSCGICEQADSGSSRGLSIDPTHPGRRFYCHGCKEGGNFMKLLARESGTTELKGKAFLALAKKFHDALQGVVGKSELQPAVPVTAIPTLRPLTNIPLSQLDNERARALDSTLPEKLTWDTAAMPSPVAKRIRRLGDSKRYDDMARMGYLTKDTGGNDRTGGTLRGLWVLEYPNEVGQNLCFMGWDHAFAEKHDTWQVEHGLWQQLRNKAVAHGRPFTAKEPREPMEYRFVKGFHRGIELWGQHVLASPSPEMQERLKTFGIFVTYHALDAATLLARHIPAVATCGTTTREQAVKAARLARTGCGVVNLVQDCTAVGEQRIREVIAIQAQAGPVRLPVTQSTDGGTFAGLRMQDLAGDAKKWAQIEERLRSGASPWDIG